jgi:branched-chain amino acid transport system ATP-binding protein
MLLELREVEAGYGAATVLHQLSLSVEAGSVTTLVGSNGAGKTTTLGVIAGTVSARAGSVLFDGVDLRKKAPHRRAELGIAHVPEGRRLFPSLSVVDNLLLGGFVKRRRRDEVRTTLDEVFERFPPLAARRKARAGTLSGGEAQLLAIGRALMSRPRLILLDEPSLGLAPRMISRVFASLATLREAGVAVLLAEQNASQALALADAGCVLERGRVILSDSAAALRGRPEVAASYLGGPTG